MHNWKHGYLWSNGSPQNIELSFSPKIHCDMLSDCGLLSQNLGNICLGNIFVRKSYQSSTNTTDLPETKQPVIAQNIALENRIFNISEFYLGTKYVISKQNSEYIYLSFKQRNHVFPNAFFSLLTPAEGLTKKLRTFIYTHPCTQIHVCTSRYFIWIPSKPPASGCRSDCVASATRAGTGSRGGRRGRPPTMSEKSPD